MTGLGSSFKNADFFGIIAFCSCIDIAAISIFAKIASK